MRERAPASIALERVTKHYAAAATPAVAELSLDVRPGECLGLLGPSGCGKTTVLNLIAGFLRLDGGSISIDGARIDDVAPHRRNIGLVFQSYALFPHLTVGANVAFGLRMRRLPRSEIGSRVTEVLRLVQLEALEARKPAELSGGQQQRVALARALVIRPRVLLLDEPLSNLDANLREELRFEIRRVQRAVGTTTIFVTHDQHEAMVVADRIAVLRSGRLEQLGAPADVYRSPERVFVATFMGQANLIRGTVVRAGDPLEVATAIGTLHSSRPSRVPAGAPAVVLVRPEHVSVSAAAAEPQGDRFPGTVTGVTYLGASTHVGVRVGDQHLRAIAADAAVIPPAGSPCLVSWSAADSLVLPDEP